LYGNAHGNVQKREGKHQVRNGESSAQLKRIYVDLYIGRMFYRLPRRPCAGFDNLERASDTIRSAGTPAS